VNTLLPDVLAPAPEARYRQRGNRCSSIGHPCPLTTWFARSALWEGRKPIDEGLARVFRVGRLWETFVMGQLRAAGLVRGEESFEWPELQLSGSWDGCFPAGRAAVDLKSMSEGAFDRADSLEALRAGTGYQRAYVAQVGLYASHPRANMANCSLYCVAKSSGRVRQISWPLDECLPEIEAAWRACRAINEELAVNDCDATSAAFGLAQTGPWCDGCDWAHLCPAYSPTACGWKLAPDDVARKIEDLAALKEAMIDQEKRKFHLEEELRSHWKASGPGEYVAGVYKVKVTQVEASEVKASTRAAYLRWTMKKIHTMEPEE
jgi:hypothetical protein